ncbi:MAG: glucosamine-6-phosphate deaminase [Treponema sp. GWB1_62_6]|nr:MAG: glucosamine-6-phosphate deaminase [Treponema sp. GWC1_61_84]OHE71930.1 MAG: glucosamine-6-phosphate deaminase [Treponema sp. GWB1_62_6]OHE76289.1 MAG: glucosamine-6-phosphate deaminase [Treponema sp. RIFOXYC1_FULL_61_9]HCM25203.1 glucosamine-6-phosphate deaminase [Treponema sp.]
MLIIVHSSKIELGKAAGRAAAAKLRKAISEKGQANLIVATGASQFETLSALVAEPDLDWSRVTAFHLDEYIGLPANHGASFRKYLKERFVDRLPGLREFVYVNGDASDPAQECRRLGALISGRGIDVGCIGIGENGHIAFNDPPADFSADEPYLVVSLDEACRAQQLGEGWFPSLADVPARAISMSVRQIMKCASLVVAVPDMRKAEALRLTVESDISPAVPASILRRHPNCTLFIDLPAASRLPARRPPEVSVEWD